MRGSRPNYLVLAAIIAGPAIIYLFQPLQEWIYAATGVAILCAFILVSYRIQRDGKRIRQEKSVEADAERGHLQRQMSAVMLFIVAGILSAVCEIVRYHLRYQTPATLLWLAAWVIYIWGIVYLVGLDRLIRKR